MRVQNYPTKIVSSVAIFLVFVAILFGYGFSWLSDKHTAALAAILEQKKTVLELRQEQHNLELAKKDLADLAQKNRLPEDFFSRDTTLVSDLSVLEAKARELQVDFILTISGTVAAAPKAKTGSELYVVPFTVQLSGDFQNIAAYLDFSEHSGTIFTVRSLSIVGGEKERITVNLVGNFFLRK